MSLLNIKFVEYVYCIVVVIVSLHSFVFCSFAILHSNTAVKEREWRSDRLQCKVEVEGLALCIGEDGIVRSPSPSPSSSSSHPHHAEALVFACDHLQLLYTMDDDDDSGLTVVDSVALNFRGCNVTRSDWTVVQTQSNAIRRLHALWRHYVKNEEKSSGASRQQGEDAELGEDSDTAANSRQTLNKSEGAKTVAKALQRAPQFSLIAVPLCTSSLTPFPASSSVSASAQMKKEVHHRQIFDGESFFLSFSMTQTTPENENSRLPPAMIQVSLSLPDILIDLSYCDVLLAARVLNEATNAIGLSVFGADNTSSSSSTTSSLSRESSSSSLQSSSSPSPRPSSSASSPDPLRYDTIVEKFTVTGRCISVSFVDDVSSSWQGARSRLQLGLYSAFSVSLLFLFVCVSEFCCSEMFSFCLYL